MPDILLKTILRYLPINRLMSNIVLDLEGLEWNACFALSPTLRSGISTLTDDSEHIIGVPTAV
jgi:hypothetical protein